MFSPSFGRYLGLFGGKWIKLWWFSENDNKAFKGEGLVGAFRGDFVK
jgi:hypothetical protein